MTIDTACILLLGFLTVCGGAVVIALCFID